MGGKHLQRGGGGVGLGWDQQQPLTGLQGGPPVTGSGQERPLLGWLQEVILESAALFTLELTAGLFGVAGRAAFAAPQRVREFSAPTAAADFCSSLVFRSIPPPPSCFFVPFKANGLAV